MASVLSTTRRNICTLHDIVHVNQNTVLVMMINLYPRSWKDKVNVTVVSTALAGILADELSSAMQATCTCSCLVLIETSKYRL